MSLTASTQLRATLTSAMLLLASFTSAQNADDSQPPPAFVVAPFDTDRTGWMPPPRLGETLAELLTARLTTEGVRVIDRSWLPEATGGAGRAADGLFERVAGRGVHYAVLGSVTRLSIERRSSSRAGLLPMPVAAGLIRKQKTETIVGLNVRVVDLRTGEVVGSATSQGGGQHQSTSGGGLAVFSKLPLVGGSRSSVTGIQDRLLDDAVQEAMEVAAAEIVAVAQRVGRPQP
jgi:curli biogenesis system outer membrane secretion channel CsgG